ncbi:MAG: hypothetical protein J2P36_02740 [Ktedonobacteraceae bacterium]|nr:hypothetical protein [Ktedonobacteraceae bacterium]
MAKKHMDIAELIRKRVACCKHMASLANQIRNCLDLTKKQHLQALLQACRDRRDDLDAVLATVFQHRQARRVFSSLYDLIEQEETCLQKLETWQDGWYHQQQKLQARQSDLIKASKKLADSQLREQLLLTTEASSSPADDERRWLSADRRPLTLDELALQGLVNAQNSVVAFLQASMLRSWGSQRAAKIKQLRDTIHDEWHTSYAVAQQAVIKQQRQKMLIEQSCERIAKGVKHCEEQVRRLTDELESLWQSELDEVARPKKSPSKP